MTKSPCSKSHYATIVEAQKDVEAYRLGDADCLDCLQRMAQKHEALAGVFRDEIGRLFK